MKKIFMVVIFISLFFISACSFQEQEGIYESEEPNDPSQEVGYINHSIFNGEGIHKDQNTYQAFGIMIENSTDARPQSALGLADIVYENAVETYTITRFLAIFASEHPTMVGPVR